MTAPVSPPPLTSPPASAPDSSDSTTFEPRADAWVSWMKAFFTADVPAFLSNCYTNAVSAFESASDASGSATTASAAATAAEAALSAVSGAIGLNTVAVTGTSQAAVTSNLYVLQNAAATTVTLPASPVAGNVVAVLVANGRIDNVIARNGKQIQGLAEDLKLDNASASVLLRYVDATSQWRLV